LIIEENSYIVVIGGANLDIKGYSEGELIRGTSNPGKVISSPGGVGCNLASVLAELNNRVFLISAVGKDPAGKKILKKTGKRAVNLEFIIQSDKYKTGTYLAVLDEKGELLAGIADMEIIKEITGQRLQERRELLAKAGLIFLDTNLTLETLSWLFKAELTARIVVDPVSLEKAGKIKEFLPQIDYLTPNLAEFCFLYDLKKPGAEGDYQKLSQLIAAKREDKSPRTTLVVSLGSQGVIYSSPLKTFYQPVPIKIVEEITETTGAGDALTAGFIHGIYHSLKPEKAVEYGQYAALMTIKSSDTVVENLASKIKAVQHGR